MFLIKKGQVNFISQQIIRTVCFLQPEEDHSRVLKADMLKFALDPCLNFIWTINK